MKDIRLTPGRHEAQRASVQHGKHRHVSTNTVTPSRLTVNVAYERTQVLNDLATVARDHAAGRSYKYGCLSWFGKIAAWCRGFFLHFFQKGVSNDIHE